MSSPQSDTISELSRVYGQTNMWPEEFLEEVELENKATLFASLLDTCETCNSLKYRVVNGFDHAVTCIKYCNLEGRPSFRRNRPTFDYLEATLLFSRKLLAASLAGNKTIDEKLSLLDGQLKAWTNKQTARFDNRKECLVAILESVKACVEQLIAGVKAESVKESRSLDWISPEAEEAKIRIGDSKKELMRLREKQRELASVLSTAANKVDHRNAKYELPADVHLMQVKEWSAKVIDLDGELEKFREDLKDNHEPIWEEKMKIEQSQSSTEVVVNKLRELLDSTLQIALEKAGLDTAEATIMKDSKRSEVWDSSISLFPLVSKYDSYDYEALANPRIKEEITIQPSYYPNFEVGRAGQLDNNSGSHLIF